jgi:type II secretion system protein C
MLGQRQQSHLFRLLVLGLLTALAAVGSDLLILRVEAALGGPNEQAAPVAPGPVEERPASLDLEVLGSRNIFNSAARQDIPAVAAAVEEDANEPVAASSLSLVLRGTWIGERSRKPADRGAWAIIEDPASHSQAVYQVGDALPGADAQVVEILPRAVKIRRGGALELLSFPENWETAADGSVLTGGAPLSPSAGLDEIRQIAPNRFQVSQRLLDYKLANLTETLTEARAIPVPGEGFRIKNIKKGSMFDKIGIQNNDLLRSVNGIELNTFEQAMKAYKLLQKEPRLHLEITRGTAPQNLDYEIR